MAASEYVFPGFRDVEVADFTAEQVKEYAAKWFGETVNQVPAALSSSWTAKENEGLRELCNVPLLLSMLCLYFDDAMSFPARRVELYEDALDALLRKWDSSREIQRDEIYRSLSPRRKMQMLAHVATDAFVRGKYYLTTRELADRLVEYLSKVPGAPAAADIDGEAVLRAIEAQHGVLVERAHNIHSFSHLSFQEYFTARYITENQVKLRTTISFSQYLTDARWREVFQLTASLLDRAEDFIEAMQTSG